MFPRSFEYFAPRTLSEASMLLRRFGDDAKLLSGGQSLVPLLKLRLLTPRYVIDMKNLRRQLAYIKESRSSIRIGALTKHAEIEHSTSLKKSMPILREVALSIGDQQVRNLGTIGGSIAHADPTADWPTAMVGLNASFVVVGRRRRVIKAQNFFKGPFTTALRPYEILTEIIIPKHDGRFGWAWKKFERRLGDYATVNTAVLVFTDEEGLIENIQISVGAAHPHPFRATDAEEMLREYKPSYDLLSEAAKAASLAAEPSTDLRGTAEFKKEMVKAFVKKALLEALSKAGVEVKR